MRTNLRCSVQYETLKQQYHTHKAKSPYECCYGTRQFSVMRDFRDSTQKSIEQHKKRRRPRLAICFGKDKIQ